MPTTLPGFLLVAGLALIVLGLASGQINIKNIPTLEFSKRAKIILLIIGVVCTLISAYVYTSNQLDPNKMPLQPLIDKNH